MRRPRSTNSSWSRGSTPVREAISGVVRLPDGSPAAGAEVALATKAAAPYIRNGRLAEPKLYPTAIAGADGTFRFPPQTEPAMVLAIDDRGIVELTEVQLAESPSHAMTLRPGDRLKGRFRVGAKPGAGELVALNPKGVEALEGVTVYYHYDVKADDHGRFTFERVVAGLVSVSRGIEIATQVRFGPWVPVEAKPGETAHVNIGRDGKVGRRPSRRAAGEERPGLTGRPAIIRSGSRCPRSPGHRT